MEKKVLKRFLVFNETTKMYSSMLELAKILNKPQRSLYNECNACYSKGENIKYFDEANKHSYIIQVIG